MKTLLHTILKHTTALLALIGCSFTLTAQAQEPLSLRLFDLPVGLIEESAEADTTSEALDNLCTTLIHLLKEADDESKQQALQNIIFLSTNFKEDVNFSRATSNLYNIFRFDQNEGYRIMALQALHAIGNETSMRQLAAHVRWERSPRVRRFTNAVLNDYYGANDE